MKRTMKRTIKRRMKKKMKRTMKRKMKRTTKRKMKRITKRKIKSKSRAKSKKRKTKILKKIRGGDPEQLLIFIKEFLMNDLYGLQEPEPEPEPESIAPELDESEMGAKVAITEFLATKDVTDTEVVETVVATLKGMGSEVGEASRWLEELHGLDKDGILEEFLSSIKLKISMNTFGTRNMEEEEATEFSKSVLPVMIMRLKAQGSLSEDKQLYDLNTMKETRTLKNFIEECMNMKDDEKRGLEKAVGIELPDAEFIASNQIPGNFLIEEDGTLIPVANELEIQDENVPLSGHEAFKKLNQVELATLPSYKCIKNYTMNELSPHCRIIIGSKGLYYSTQKMGWPNDVASEWNPESTHFIPYSAMQANPVSLVNKSRVGAPDESIAKLTKVEQNKKIHLVVKYKDKGRNKTVEFMDFFMGKKRHTEESLYMCGARGGPLVREWVIGQLLDGLKGEYTSRDQAKYLHPLTSAFEGIDQQIVSVEFTGDRRFPLAWNQHTKQIIIKNPDVAEPETDEGKSDLDMVFCNDLPLYSELDNGFVLYGVGVEMFYGPAMVSMLHKKNKEEAEKDLQGILNMVLNFTGRRCCAVDGHNGTLTGDEQAILKFCGDEDAPPPEAIPPPPMILYFGPSDLKEPGLVFFSPSAFDIAVMDAFYRIRSPELSDTMRYKKCRVILQGAMNKPTPCHCDNPDDCLCPNWREVLQSRYQMEVGIDPWEWQEYITGRVKDYDVEKGPSVSDEDIAVLDAFFEEIYLRQIYRKVQCRFMLYEAMVINGDAPDRNWRQALQSALEAKYGRGPWPLHNSEEPEPVSARSVLMLPEIGAARAPLAA